MPGGRGTIEDIAEALNGDKHETTADALIMAITEDGYEVQLSASSIGRAIDLCDNLKSLVKVLCAAYEHKRTNWGY